MGKTNAESPHRHRELRSRVQPKSGSRKLTAGLKWVGEKLITPFLIGLIIFAANLHATDARKKVDQELSAEQSRTAREVEERRADSSERLENLRFVRQLAQVEGVDRFSLGAPGLDLAGVDLSGLDITGLNLNKVNFTGVRADILQAANPKRLPTSEEYYDNLPPYTRLRMQLNSTVWDHALLGAFVQFDGAEMHCASFREARLSSLGPEGNVLDIPNVFREYIPLEMTDLMFADLRGIEFVPGLRTYARVGNVWLAGADVRGVDFRDVDLEGVEWGDVIYDDTTLWPTNYTPPSRAEGPEKREMYCKSITEGVF